MARSSSNAARRLRILHVVTAYYPAVRYGGPVRSVHGLASALVRAGHEVHVYTTSMDGESDLDVPLEEPVDLDGVMVHYFRVPALRRLFWAPSLSRRLRSSISDFDVVHIHGAFLLPLRAAARAALKSGVPYVVTPHGMLIGDVIRRRSRWAKSAWIGLVERRTLSHAAGMHVTAALERAEIRALKLPTPAIVRDVPNGLDFPETPVELAQTPFSGLSRPYALFLSRISWKKGLDRLIRAWQHVPDLPLVIAGNDDEGYRPKLETLARSLGIADRVRFIGPATDEQKWALYSEAKLFLLPSYSENFGIVVAEAMGMGCPVVVTPEVGIAQLVKAADAGIVTTNEPHVLAAAVIGLLQDERRRRELGRRGRDFARGHLSWAHVVRRMEELYVEAIGEPASGSTRAYARGA